MKLLSYEEALPVIAKQLPRPEPIRTAKQPTDKVLVHPALERWWKEKGRG